LILRSELAEVSARRESGRGRREDVGAWWGPGGGLVGAGEGGHARGPVAQHGGDVGEVS
jgi:hypothetical protein